MIDASWFQHLSPSEQEALLEGPALKPPPGVIPDLRNPPNKNRMGSEIMIAACIINGVLVLINFYARYIFHRKMGIEDCATIAALCVFGGFIYTCWEIVIFPGFFVHQWNIRLRDLSRFLFYMNTGLPVYGIVILLLKTSILLHWANIFVPKGIRNGFWWTCHIVLGINVLFYVVSTFLTIFACSPREKLWKPMLPGTCLNSQTINIASSTLNLLSDLAIMILPQKVIWSLQMAFKQKIGIAALFAIGLFANICAAFRTRSAYQFRKNWDVTWNVSDIVVWSIAEITAGFIVLCLPALPKVFNKWAKTTKLLNMLRGHRKVAPDCITSPVHSSKRRRRPGHITLDSEDYDPVSLSNIHLSETEVRSEFVGSQDT